MFVFVALHIFVESRRLELHVRKYTHPFVQISFAVKFVEAFSHAMLALCEFACGATIAKRLKAQHKNRGVLIIFDNVNSFFC